MQGLTRTADRENQNALGAQTRHLSGSVRDRMFGSALRER